MAKRGLFITFEGMDGCGKTTQMRWLGKRLRGFEKASPKQLFRRFVETPGEVEVEEERVVVRFDKRSHNPVLREAALDQERLPIPWLNNLPVSFVYR